MTFRRFCLWLGDWVDRAAVRLYDTLPSASLPSPTRGAHMTDTAPTEAPEGVCPGFGPDTLMTDATAYAVRSRCTAAPTVAALLSEATGRWPGRSRASDGTCGDAAHAARKSDHNPAADGFAHACDLTHDPAHGVDTYVLADRLRLAAKSGQERRVKYIISNRRIASGPGWDWRYYDGSNPHDHHMHVSVTPAATHDVRPWFGFGQTGPPPAVPPPTAEVCHSPGGHPLLQQGAKGEAVVHVQNILRVSGARIANDGDFGPVTKAALVAHQRWLVDVRHEPIGAADAVCGRKTWQAMHNWLDGRRI